MSSEERNGLISAKAKVGSVGVSELFRALTELAIHSEEADWGQAAGAHLRRVGLYAGAVAAELGMAKRYCAEISLAAKFHDIGKIFTPLSSSHGYWFCSDWGARHDFAAHTIRGHAYLNKINPKIGVLKTAADIALNHHEAWNGKGVPYGRRCTEIPYCARIVAVVDFYETCVHFGGRREKLTREDVVVLIESSSGEHFDPAVVNAFTRMFKRCV